MQSIFDRIDADVVQLKKLLRQLNGYSGIVRWNFSAIKISGMSDYKWEELNADGKKIQAQSVALFDRFISFVRCLRSDLSGPGQHALKSSAQVVKSIIEQTNFLNTLNKEELFLYVINRIEQQHRLLAAAYELTDEWAIILPDPALLVTHPALGTWQVSEIPQFKVLSVPPQSLQLTAQHATGKILPWLDPENPEDLLIGACFELIKENPHTPVILATNNPSLQKKATASNLPYIELPDVKPETPTVKAVPPVESAPPEPLAKSIAKPAARAANTTTGKPTPAPAATKPRPANKPAPAAPLSIPPVIRPEVIQSSGLNHPYMTNNLPPAMLIQPSTKPNLIKVPNQANPAKSKNIGLAPGKPVRK